MARNGITAFLANQEGSYRHGGRRLGGVELGSQKDCRHRSSVDCLEPPVKYNRNRDFFLFFRMKLNFSFSSAINFQTYPVSNLPLWLIWYWNFLKLKENRAGSEKNSLIQRLYLFRLIYHIIIRFTSQNSSWCRLLVLHSAIRLIYCIYIQSL